MTEDANRDQPPKLPVLAIATEAYGAVLSNPGLMLQLFIPWIVLLGITTLLLVAVMLRVFPLPVGILQGMQGDWSGLTGADIWFVLAGIAYVVVWAVAFCSIAVGWHRFQLLGETLEGFTYHRLDRSVWRYAGQSLLLSVLFIAGAVPIAAPFLGGVGVVRPSGTTPGAPHTGGIQYFLLVLIVSIVSMGLLSRFLLVLPSGALQQPMTLRQSWSATDGNTLRLIGLTACVYVPNALIGPLLDSFLPFGEELSASFAWRAAIEFLIALFLMMVGVSTLSLTYRHLVERR